VSNSWKLTGACFKVLWRNPKLIVYPFITFIASTWILVGFLGYSYGMQVWVESTEGSKMMLVVMILLGSLFIYFMISFVAVLSNAAIIGASGMLLQGKEPTIGDGYSIALSRLGSLVTWAGITGFVSFVTSFGRFLLTAVGIAWSVITYFVIPVMLFEGVGPFRAIKRSREILRARWGESLITNFSVWTTLGLIYIVLMVLFLLIGIFFLTMNSAYLVLYILALTIMVTFSIGLVAYTLKGILMTSLYWYSVTGDPGFDLPEGPLKALIRKR
jgi:hypothetical protein